MSFENPAELFLKTTQRNYNKAAQTSSGCVEES